MTKASAHVCLVSPGFLATNPRLHKEAATLARAGYRVTVVAQRAGALHAMRIDRDTLEGQPVALRAFHAGDRRAYLCGRIVQAALGWVERLGDYAPSGLLARRHYALHGALLERTLAQRADLYIGHNLQALPVVAAAAAYHGARYAFDVEDLHVEELPDQPENRRERALRAALERRWLPGAAYVSAAAETYRPLLAERYGINATTIRNVFPRHMAPAAPRAATSPPTLSWVSQVIGPDRGLEPMLSVISHMRARPILRLRGRRLEPFASDLAARAERLGVRMEFNEPVAPFDLARVDADASLCLGVEVGSSLNKLLAWSNKTFLSVLSGVPIALSTTPGQRALIESLGAAALAIDLHQPEASAALLDAYLDDAPRQRDARAHAWRLGQDKLNWDCEESLLLALVNSALRP